MKRPGLLASGSLGGTELGLSGLNAPSEKKVSFLRFQNSLLVVYW